MNEDKILRVALDWAVDEVDPPRSFGVGIQAAWFIKHMKACLKMTSESYPLRTARPPASFRD